MPRSAILKPAFRKKRSEHGLAAWAVNVPPQLSPTGRRQELFFATKGEAATECERLKARKANFGTSLSSLSPSKIAKAAEAYKILEPLNIDLLDAVRHHVATIKARSASISFGDA